MKLVGWKQKCSSVTLDISTELDELEEGLEKLPISSIIDVIGRRLDQFFCKLRQYCVRQHCKLDSKEMNFCLK